MGPFLAAGEILAGSRKGRRDKSSNGEESPEAVQKNLIRNLIGVLVFLSNRPMSIRVSGCRRGGIHRRCQHHLPSVRLPRAEGFILADMTNAVGLATIFLTLVQSAISLYFFDTLGKEKLSRFPIM